MEARLHQGMWQGEQLPSEEQQLQDAIRASLGLVAAPSYDHGGVGGSGGGGGGGNGGGGGGSGGNGGDADDPIDLGSSDDEAQAPVDGAFELLARLVLYQLHSRHEAKAADDRLMQVGSLRSHPKEAPCRPPQSTLKLRPLLQASRRSERSRRTRFSASRAARRASQASWGGRGRQAWTNRAQRR